MEYNTEVFSISYPLWRRFVYHYCAYKELTKQFERLPEDKEFWVYTCDAHLEMATVYWCMIFGTDSNETHWKKLELDNDQFRRYLLKGLNISYGEWSKYQKNMLSFRNEYVAHRPKVYNKPVPVFTLALDATILLERWVREQIKPDILEDEPLATIVTRNKKDIQSTVLKVIHKKPCIFLNKLKK